MKKFLAIGVLGIFILLKCGINYSYAGEIDILLDKLVEKGVLTPGEAQQIGTETKEQVKKEIAQGKYSSLPAWVQNTKIKGDIRLRYQYKHEYTPTTYAKDAQVGRIRLRLGLESKINEKLMAGIGIATNSNGDPRSTNITFGDTADGGYSSKMGIRLDYAYAKYSPFSWMNLVGGKMLLNDALWEPTDLVWDTDITPEGGILQLNKTLGPNATFFLFGGPLIQTADTSTNADSMVAYLIQPGLTYKFNDTFSLKSAFLYQDFSNAKNSDYPTASWYKSSNTKNGTKWKYGFRTISPQLELTVADPFRPVGLNVENLKVFGEYVNNLAAPAKNTGFALGFQLGNAKIEKWGDWQFRYIYGMLEKDSVIDVTPDSDRYGGKTGMRSYEGILSYGLGKNTFLAVDMYRSWNIMSPSAKSPETLVQVDWNAKF